MNHENPVVTIDEKFALIEQHEEAIAVLLEEIEEEIGLDESVEDCIFGDDDDEEILVALAVRLGTVVFGVAILAAFLIGRVSK